MIAYPLTRGLLTLIDDDDLPLIEQYAPWHAGEFGRRGLWYAVTNVRTERGWRTAYMHRLLMGAQGHRAKVDHKNGDGLDNQRVNLQFLDNGSNIQKGRPFEQKLFTRDMAPKETTKRRFRQQSATATQQRRPA